jgi:hypothetical protein
MGLQDSHTESQNSVVASGSHFWETSLTHGFTPGEIRMQSWVPEMSLQWGVLMRANGGVSSDSNVFCCN